MSIKIKYKLPKNYAVLVHDEKVLRHFWGRDFEKKGAIVRIKKANAILKCPANKLFPT